MQPEAFNVDGEKIHINLRCRKLYDGIFVSIKNCIMLENPIPLFFEIKGKIFSGFCMQIHDQFHDTYAVVLQGYQSFSIWSDVSKNTWFRSKNICIDQDVISEIINSLSTT